MNLDIKQKEVVEYLGNMLVLAGAGTGKTFCIKEKIKYLKEKYHANDKDFLVVSFTNESVNDLKRKINNVEIYTFHKLALKILPENIYKLCSDKLLEYIIEEYFISFVTKSEKRKLCIYFWTLSYQKLLNNINFISFQKMIYTYIKLIQCNNLDLNYLKAIYKEEKDILFITIIIKIYQIYKKEKEAQKVIDLDDLIVIATSFAKKQYFYYKYIFVDEFQDTSQIRFNLIKEIYLHSNSNVYFFGDDFQSIYHFSGCDLNIMLNIQKEINNLKIMKLAKTFRNSQELINIANDFIMKNKKQLEKSMISDKHLKNPVEIIYYDNPKNCFKKIISKLDIKTTLILGRNNNDFKNFTDNINDYWYLTVHKSKGLEAENIILINLQDDIFGFPNKIKNYYLIDKINPLKEIKYAEERRLFYVALTRTKGKVYLLVPRINPSVFIKEIKKIKDQN